MSLEQHEEMRRNFAWLFPSWERPSKFVQTHRVIYEKSKNRKIEKPTTDGALVLDVGSAQTMRLQVQMFLSVASGSLGPATVRAFVPTAAPVVSSFAVRLSSMSTLLQTRATAARLQQQSASPSSYAMRRAALSTWGWASSSSSSSLGRRSLSCNAEAAAGGGGGGGTIFYSSFLFART